VIREGIMSEITTAEDAIRKADSFLSKYYIFHRLETVKKEGDTWVVRYDVSVLGPKEITTIKLDAKTGSVVEYTSND
jgi:uncharacterized membrane protein YkoI